MTKVTIYGRPFEVGPHDWYAYITEASSRGETHWFNSKDIDECRHFIESVIAKDGGMAKIEMWDLTTLGTPRLERVVTHIACTPELPQVVFRKPPKEFSS